MAWLWLRDGGFCKGRLRKKDVILESPVLASKQPGVMKNSRMSQVARTRAFCLQSGLALLSGSSG